METKNKLKKALTLLMLSISIFVAVETSFADANMGAGVNKNTAVEVRPDLGPMIEKGLVGENGYKVFNPGAIASAPIISKNRGLAASIYRSGWTDAWLSLDWNSWEHHGNHDSSSDLWETHIGIDGRLKVTIDSGWRDTCSIHTSGSSYLCSTSFHHVLPRTIKAESTHTFQTPGYVDEIFYTADNA
jgi:hypothetical protein